MDVTSQRPNVTDQNEWTESLERTGCTYLILCLQYGAPLVWLAASATARIAPRSFRPLVLPSHPLITQRQCCTSQKACNEAGGDQGRAGSVYATMFDLSYTLHFLCNSDDLHCVTWDT